MDTTRLTHDGTISSDGDTYSYRCDRWQAPDNTQGRCGWHVVYRPLAAGYKGHEDLTPEMLAATREHDVEMYARAEARRVATEAAVVERIRHPQPEPEGLCPRCGTYCYGDCNAR